MVSASVHELEQAERFIIRNLAKVPILPKMMFSLNAPVAGDVVSHVLQAMVAVGAIVHYELPNYGLAGMRTTVYALKRNEKLMRDYYANNADWMQSVISGSVYGPVEEAPTTVAEVVQPAFEGFRASKPQARPIK